MSAVVHDVRAAGEATQIVRDRPYPAAWGVRKARDAYLKENGFTVAAYDAKKTEASFFFLRFSVPNTPVHRWAIMLHDLHHVATGFGTDLVGEAEISAWELRRGLRGLGIYVGAIVASGALFGLVIAPRRTLAAWRASGRSGSLFQAKESYDELLDMSIGELRRKLGVPERGVSERPRKLHPRAPARR